MTTIEFQRFLTSVRASSILKTPFSIKYQSFNAKCQISVFFLFSGHKHGGVDFVYISHIVYRIVIHVFRFSHCAFSSKENSNLCGNQSTFQFVEVMVV